MDLVNCIICDYSGRSRYMRPHYLECHNDAYRANSLYDRDYRAPAPGLPRCDVCEIYIGHDMDRSHLQCLPHLQRFKSNPAAFHADDGVRGDGNAGGGGGGRGGGGDDDYIGHYSDHSGDDCSGEGGGVGGDRSDGTDDSYHGGGNGGASAGIGGDEARLIRDWLPRRDLLPYNKHHLIGEVFMSTAAIDKDDDIDLIRNQDWGKYRRVRIVDINTRQDGVEVHFMFFLL